MSIYRLTGVLEVPPPIRKSDDQMPSPSYNEKWYPGLVNGEYARERLGDALFERAVAVGVLVSEG